MPKSAVFVNQRYNRLVVIGKTSEKGKCGNYYVEVQCDCGTKTKMLPSTLRRSMSCGCYRKEVGILRGKASAKHGEGSNGKESPEYRCWASMLSRCNNVNHQMYPHYGARGISVCEAWSDYQTFLKDMGRKPSSKHSIDRIDVNGNYEPSNCRWVDGVTQNRNKTNNRYITIGTETKALAGWLEDYQMNRHTFESRVRSGMSEVAALTTAIRKRKGKQPI